MQGQISLILQAMTTGGKQKPGGSGEMDVECSCSRMAGLQFGEIHPSPHSNSNESGERKLAMPQAAVPACRLPFLDSKARNNIIVKNIIIKRKYQRLGKADFPPLLGSPSTCHLYPVRLSPSILLFSQMLLLKIKRFLLVYIKIYFSCVCNSFIMSSRLSHTANEDPAWVLGKESVAEGSIVPKKGEKQESESVCLGSKKKKLLKKPESLLGRLKLEFPLSFEGVHNIFNLMALNECALKNADCEESYFKTMFYTRAVERVELRRHALILQLRPTEHPPSPIEYLVNRYRSFGDNKFYKLAAALEAAAGKVQREQTRGFTRQLMRSFDSEPLSRFIDSMAGETYMCKVAPNKLVISRALLELLGEDPEAYAIELCKYRAPLREIISAELYCEILAKSVEQLGLVCDYMAGQVSHDELHTRSTVDFNDYIYDRHQRRIYCNLVLFMPTPQISCVQMREIVNEGPHCPSRCPTASTKRTLLNAHCRQRRFTEAELLKNIVKLPQGMLQGNEQRLAGYKEKLN